jgi:hypothetical protein
MLAELSELLALGRAGVVKKLEKEQRERDSGASDNRDIIRF